MVFRMRWFVVVLCSLLFVKARGAALRQVCVCACVRVCMRVRVHVCLPIPFTSSQDACVSVCGVRV